MSDIPARGLTPNEVAKLLRVSPDKIRSLIKRGELSAIDLGVRGGKPRFIVLPRHLEEFERRHRAATPTKPAPRPRRAVGQIDFYPGE